MPVNKRRNLAIAVGAGFALDEFGQSLFIGEDPDGKTIFTVLDDKVVDYTRNRFNTSIIEVPIEFRWRTSTPESYRFGVFTQVLKLATPFGIKAHSSKRTTQ